MNLTGTMLSKLLEAAASGAECVETDDGTEVTFAESLRSIAESAHEIGPERVGLIVRLSLVDDEGYVIEGDEGDDE